MTTQRHRSALRGIICALFTLALATSSLGLLELRSQPAGAASIGPWLSSIDEFEDPDDVGLGCAIDGVVVQDARSSDMAFPVPKLLAILSGIITLEPGDVLFTGSPAGAGMGHHPPRYLRPGQVLTTWVESVGEMRHLLVDGRPR